MAGQLIIEEQHPIPQQISSFQFHLVGDMTLQQFLQVAGGALVALLIYASPLPPYLKWPLILMSFGIGAALAFLPLEDRPLAVWVVSFFKSIYSPTIYSWEKMDTLPQYFAPEEAMGAVTPIAETGVEVSETTPAPPEETKLEKKEEAFLSKILHLSGLGSSLTSKATVVNQAPTSGSILEQPTTDQQATDKKPPIKNDTLAVPGAGAVSVEPTSTEEKKETEDKTPAPNEPFSTSKVAPVIGTTSQGQSVQAKFSDDAAPPMPPTNPNTIVGQVVDPDGKIVEGAILEIKDAEGRPARALRSNKLGHFMIATQLINGKYEITIEKDGLEFEPLSFEAIGEIIPPIAIWAKSKIKEQQK